MLKNPALRNTIGYYLLFICLGLGLGIVGPTLPSLASQTGVTIGSIGGIFLASAIGYTLGTTAGGWMFDRVSSGHLALGLAQLTSASLLFLIPLCPTLWILILVNTVIGLSNGIINTGANTLLMWNHREQAGPYMNGLHFSFGLGAFLAPSLFGLFLNLGATHRETYWTIAAVAIPVALFILFLPGSPRPLQHHETERVVKVNLRPYLPIVIISMLYLFFYVGAEITYVGWIYTYATSLELASVTQAAYLTSSFWLAFTIGRLLSIPIATRFRPEQVIAIALIASLVILGAGLFLTNSLSLLWVVSTCLGFCMAPLWPSGYTLASQSIKLTARASSLILLGDSFGGMILPWVTGGVLERFGAQTMIWLVFVSLGLSFLAFLGMLRQRDVLHKAAVPA
jgi:fucose permease